jgi:hypothetical protein
MCASSAPTPASASLARSRSRRGCVFGGLCWCGGSAYTDHFRPLSRARRSGGGGALLRLLCHRCTRLDGERRRHSSSATSARRARQQSAERGSERRGSERSGRSRRRGSRGRGGSGRGRGRGSWAPRVIGIATGAPRPCAQAAILFQVLFGWAQRSRCAACALHHGPAFAAGSAGGRSPSHSHSRRCRLLDGAGRGGG